MSYEIQYFLELYVSHLKVLLKFSSNAVNSRGWHYWIVEVEGGPSIVATFWFALYNEGRRSNDKLILY